MSMRAMATAKSDDDADERQPHPLAQNRPGVYVQVVGTPRKRKAERARREAEVASAPPQAEQELAHGRESPDQDTARPSGVEPNARTHAAAAPEQRAGSESFGAGARREEPSGFGSRASRSAPTVEVTGVSGPDSENTNHRADLMRVPGPPRMPSISLSGAPLPAQEAGASLLDAPRSLRPDSLPAEKKTSWALLAFVATLSAIITAAVVVAVREKSAPEALEARGAAPAQKIDRARAAVGAQQVEPRHVPSAEPAPVAAPVQQPAEAPPAAGESDVAPAAPTPVAAQPQAAPSVESQPTAAPAVHAAAVRAALATPAATATAAVQPLRKPAPALAPRRPAAVPAQPGSAPAAAPTPAQIIAEHARTLAPVELPSATDTALPANPYEAPAEE
jgi:hypothetical protein